MDQELKIDSGQLASCALNIELHQGREDDEHARLRLDSVHHTGRRAQNARVHELHTVGRKGSCSGSVTRVVTGSVTGVVTSVAACASLARFLPSAVDKDEASQVTQPLRARGRRSAGRTGRIRIRIRMLA